MGSIGPKDLSSPKCSLKNFCQDFLKVCLPRFSLFAFRFFKAYLFRRMATSASSNSSAIASCASSSMSTNSTPTPIPGTQ